MCWLFTDGTLRNRKCCDRPVYDSGAILGRTAMIDGVTVNCSFEHDKMARYRVTDVGHWVTTLHPYDLQQYHWAFRLTKHKVHYLTD